uniref:Uncharacterized protein n=1 Tax=Parastrongyloides trichosuri TaxID=131310 RepID=A0A0N4ZF49_PARTI
MFKRAILLVLSLIYSQINGDKLTIKLCLAKQWTMSSESDGLSITFTEYENHRDTKITAYFFDKENEIEEKVVLEAPKKYIYNSEVGVDYTCFDKEHEFTVSGNKNFNYGLVILKHSSNKKLAYSVLDITHEMKNVVEPIKFIKLPFDGYVLTNGHYLVIDTRIGTERVLKASDGDDFNYKIYKTKILKQTSINKKSSDEEPSMGSHFLPLFFAVVVLTLILCLLICIICYCRQNSFKNRRFREATTIVEKEWFSKILTETIHTEDSNTEGVQTEN